MLSLSEGENKPRTRGAGLIEVVVGSGLIAIVLMGLVTTFHLYLKASLTNTERVQAAFLAEEGLEVMRYFRDAGWSGNIAPLTKNTSYFLSYSGSSWTITTTEVLDGAFRRTITLEDAWRRTSDQDLVSASSSEPKAVDADARRVVVYVEAPGLKSELVSYLTDLFDN